MKRILSILVSLALLMSAFLFAGCGKQSEPDTPDDGPLSGGWTATEHAETYAIPDAAKAAFEAMRGAMVGSTYMPVAYLGSQVVSGTNYAFICNVTPVTPEGKTSVEIVKFSYNADNGPEFGDSKALNIADYTEEKSIDFEQVPGGWDCTEAAGGSLDADAKEAFDKAMEGMTGVSYEPILQLGTQVVAGTNYAILCKATSATAEPVTKLAVLVIYADLEGGASLSTICPFEF